MYIQNYEIIKKGNVVYTTINLSVDLSIPLIQKIKVDFHSVRIDDNANIIIRGKYEREILEKELETFFNQ